MTDQHPITPLSELVELWITEVWHEGTPVRVAASDLHIATQAARWGADQELEACCDFLELEQRTDYAALLHAARRPKPPSLKEQASASLDAMADTPNSPPLSPAAQAVLDAFNRGWDPNLAAALLAVADQVEHYWDGTDCIDHLRAIAAELEGDHG